jgi:tRNA G18 (ribose-2'-O)-methylase SpoU
VRVNHNSAGAQFRNVSPGLMFLTICGMDRAYRKQRSSKNCALEFLGQAEQETIPVHKQKKMNLTKISHRPNKNGIIAPSHESK